MRERKLLFELSKDYVDLALAEVKALTEDENPEVYDNIVITKNADERKILKRVALTKAVYEFLFKCNENELKIKVKDFDWNSLITNTFWVRLRHTSKFNEAEIADIIWDALENPKAEIESKDQIVFIFSNKKVFCGKLIGEPSKEYNTRKPHLRPEHSPASLQPKIARAMINLTGIKKGVILDPFCGVGGILIENGLMGLTSVGYEIDTKTFYKCKRNLEHYGIRYYHINNEDSLKITKDFDYVVTDLPYGRSSKLSEKREELYDKFLKLLENHLKVKAVIMYPHYSNFAEMIKKYKLKVENEFSIYVHKNLTRKIVVLSPKR